VHPVIYGDNVHLSVKRTPEFQGHMTPQKARKTRSFKIRKRRLAHSFPLTAFKINISIIFMQLQSVKCLTNYIHIHVHNSMKFHQLQSHTFDTIAYLFDQIHDVSVLLFGCFDKFQLHLVTFQPCFSLQQGLNQHCPVSQLRWAKVSLVLAQQPAMVQNGGHN
jgi:hypothetical protein